MAFTNLGNLGNWKIQKEDLGKKIVVLTYTCEFQMTVRHTDKRKLDTTVWRLMKTLVGDIYLRSSS